MYAVFVKMHDVIIIIIIIIPFISGMFNGGPVAAGAVKSAVS